MKYPYSTKSKPVVGEEAKRLVEAVQSGGYLANDAAKATISRIVERRRNKTATNDQTGKIRGR